MTETNHKQHSSEELLSKAAGWDDDLGGTTRNGDGSFVDWEKWSTAHPQRATIVSVCNGRGQWANAASHDETRLSVVSWNILSDTWYRRDKDCVYAHTPEEHGEWENRFRLLMEWLESLRPDVIALQEVDFVLFESHLRPALGELGYEGVVQKPKKRSAKQPCGNATFWAAGKLGLAGGTGGGVGMFSRALGTAFETKGGRRGVSVANVHLESAQTAPGADRRARQMKSALEWAARTAPGLPLVVAGDCNTGADAPLFAVLRDHRWYGHDLASAYEHPSAERTAPSSRCTFAVPGRHYLIDQLWYSHESMRLDHLMDPLTEDEKDVCLGSDMEGGLPNHVCPSDHLPIGAVFTLLVQTDKAPRPEEDNAVLPERDPLRPQSRSRLEEEFDRIMLQAPKKVTGKPTPEQIAQMKSHGALVKGWIQSLPVEEQSFVLDLKKKKRKQGAEN